MGKVSSLLPTSSAKADGQDAAFPGVGFYRSAMQLGRLVATIPADENAASEALTSILTLAGLVLGIPSGALRLENLVRGEAFSLDENGHLYGACLQPQGPDPIPNLPTWDIPLRAGAQTVGLLRCSIDPTSVLPLQKEALESLVHFAALAFDRGRQPQEGQVVRALQYLLALSNVTSEDEDDLKVPREIARVARELSSADFVVLYEYFEEKRDVRLPPTIDGKLRRGDVLEQRGAVISHRHSAVFRLLDENRPFFAPHGAFDWIESGIIAPPTISPEASFFDREEVLSSAGIPLTMENERLGVLFFNYRRPQPFGTNLQDILLFLGRQAGLALGNARFFLRARRYSRNLGTLSEIGREFASVATLDIAALAETIREKVQRIFPTKNFFLALYDRDHDSYSLHGLTDQRDDIPTLREGVSRGLTNYVCRTREPLLATRGEQEQLFREGKASLVGSPSAIWLGAPLLVRDEVLGALVVQDFDDESIFTQEHLHLFTAIASQVAVVIDNYHLVADKERRVRELSALLEVSNSFARHKLTPSELLTSILDHLCELASGDGSLLFLKEPTSAGSERLRVRAYSSALGLYRKVTMNLGQGLAGRVVVSGESQFVNNYATWEGRAEDFVPPPERVCAAPLVWDGRIIGVLTLSSDNIEDHFSDADLRTLERFAAHAAVALNTASDAAFREALIDAVPYAIVAVDSAGLITEFNEEAARLFDDPTRTLHRKAVTDLYWDGLENARSVQRNLFEFGRIRDLEVFGRSRRGEKLPLSLGASLLRDDRDEVMGSVGVLEDLRVQSLHGRTQLLIEQLREINGCDLDQIGDVLVNAAVALLYADNGALYLCGEKGLDLEAVVGFDAGTNGPRLAAPSFEEGLRLLLAKNLDHALFLPEDAPLESLDLPDSIRSACVAPIRTDAASLGLLLLESTEPSQFVGDRQLVEILAAHAAISVNRLQLLRDNEKVQRNLQVSANAVMVGQLATTFIHEAKNSLNTLGMTVLAVSEKLERENELKTRATYLKRLATVQDELSRLENLTRRLQRFTQQGQGLKPSKLSTYVNEVVRTTLDLMEGALREKGIRIDVNLDNSLDAPQGGGHGNPILIDPDQIQQVLMNLLLNAIAASGSKSTISIVTRNAHERVEIRVRDQGVGLADDVRRQLFQPYFTTKRNGGGLGLFLSRILIEENHSGTIEVLSAGPGKGTTLVVVLPSSN